MTTAVVNAEAAVTVAMSSRGRSRGMWKGREKHDQKDREGGEGEEMESEGGCGAI